MPNDSRRRSRPLFWRATFPGGDAERWPPHAGARDKLCGGALDGISLIHHAREIQPSLPVIVFTGMGYEEEKMHAALRAGANGYVSKHLPVEQLYCVLLRVLTTCRQRARREALGPGAARLARCGLTSKPDAI